jgi:hypothetical protein
MKKLIWSFSLAALGGALSVVGQSPYALGPVLGFGYGFNGFNTEGLNTFVRTHNNYLPSAVKQPFNDYGFSSMRGFYGAAGMRFMRRDKGGGVWGVFYQWGSARHRNSSHFTNGRGRELDLRFSTHDVMVEGGFQIKGIAFLEALVGMMIRKVGLYSHILYADGSRSLGTEYDLNGYYHVTEAAPYVGGAIGFRIWHFFFPLRIMYSFSVFGHEASLTDFDVMRFRQTEFPRDVGVFIQDVMGEKFETNRVPQSDFNGLRVQFGVEFMMPLFK